MMLYTGSGPVNNNPLTAPSQDTLLFHGTKAERVLRQGDRPREARQPRCGLPRLEPRQRNLRGAGPAQIVHLHGAATTTILASVGSLEPSDVKHGELVSVTRIRSSCSTIGTLRRR